MKKRIYHGSQNIIEQPIYGKGKKYNDYGQGFYCTENEELAKEWACFQMENGYLNAYSIEIDKLKVLNLTLPDYHILNWLAILLENRTFQIKTELANQAKQYIINHYLVPYNECDIIIGYRADDSYFSFAEDFIQGIIPLKTLEEAMKLGKLGEQIVLISKKAFDSLKYERSEVVSYTEYFSKRVERDQQARHDYVTSRESIQFNKEDIYILDILREEMKNNDQRLR